MHVSQAGSTSRADLRRIGELFRIRGRLVDVRPHGSGHINDTFAATYDQAGTAIRYLHQRINTRIFTRPDALMDNIARVLAHGQSRVAALGDASRRVLTLVPARDGTPYARVEDAGVWRTYVFIEGARTVDVVETEAQAEAAARAFGAYQHLLADLPGPRLHEVLPFFHHTPTRFEACVAAIEADPHNRASAAREAIAFALARAADVPRMVDAHARGDIPERVTHNDTKINNVLIDEASGEGLCVVDLDTTMPGLAPYDFGDLVRTTTNAAAEDHPDASGVYSRPEIFSALARGYLATAGPMLTPGEVALLPFAGQLISLEQGLRFLADYLQGDTYYRIHRPGQNLDRARAQFAMAASIERQSDAYERVVRSAWG